MLKRVLGGEPVGETTFEERQAEASLSSVEPQCMNCVWWDRETMTTCKAFPNGIPVAILMNKFDHRYPWGVEFEDQGYQYQPFAVQDAPKLLRV